MVHDGVPVLTSQNLRQKGFGLTRRDMGRKPHSQLTACRIKLLYRAKGNEHKLIAGLGQSSSGAGEAQSAYSKLIKIKSFFGQKVNLFLMFF